MPKGRQNNPPTENVGKWYKHSNCREYLTIGSRSTSTSTGTMSNDSMKFINSAPPPTFLRRTQTRYQDVNPFSNHDNRNTIQLTGEYLGDGRNNRDLGRRLTEETQNQHRNDVRDFLKHHSRDVTNSYYHSNYMLSHDRKSIPLVEYRRFPKTNQTPSSGTVELSTSTTNQFTTESGALPYNTPTQTLVSSLEPHLKKNTWKYSYHRHKKYDIYPKVWGDRCTVRLPSYKPRSRPVIVNRIDRSRTQISDLCV